MSDQKQFLNSSRRKKLDVLMRRANFLQAEISTTNEQLRGRSFARAELAALEFAIATIREHYPPTDGKKHDHDGA